MAERTIITPGSAGGGAGPYVDWPAIFAGAVVATGIGIVFAGFGAALGLSALSFRPGEGSGVGSLILTGLWALITVIVSYGAGGYIAGRMRRKVEGLTDDESQARDSIQGMVVWGLGVIVGVWFAGSVLGTAANAVGNVAGGVAQAAGAAVGGAASGAATLADDGGLDLGNFNPIEAVNNRLLRGTGVQVDPNATVSPVARDALFDVARTGEITPENRQILIEEVARTTNLSPAEAEARVDQAIAEVNQLRADAERQVREAGEAARRSAVLTGFLVAAGFAIAFAAAAYGAVTGGRHRDEGRLWRGFRSY
ncbi:hypothetical protein [Rubellimicrobium sp. CFH 75288]|uniref:hypothetical protein n=1 Tax=Rubellimicrobium sp. CFH 75288 TaxID=2697034 RepID=UPI0014129151|nr:hypothetical protein [Rubellimicrobium sp. CFH 75288]NAZ36825.1 hypothetical protein [Rubellimicrobium sp. CFH 75288]